MSRIACGNSVELFFSQQEPKTLILATFPISLITFPFSLVFFFHLQNHTVFSLLWADSYGTGDVNDKDKTWAKAKIDQRYEGKSN